MSEISRRDVLRRLALTLTATGFIDRVAAGRGAPDDGAVGRRAGPTRRRRSAPRSSKTLERLTDIIIPVENGAPGALAAGAAAWIDMISSENDELKASYAKGFAWLDGAMKGRGAADFVSATRGPADRARSTSSPIAATRHRS